MQDQTTTRVERMARPFTSLVSRIAVITITTSLFYLSSSLPPASSTAVPARPRPFKKIYAFGDSYTDTGNTVSATGPNTFNHVSSLPYGHTFFHHPTNRYSDGRLVIDFVAQALSLPYLPPYLSKNADKSTGVNFAVGGATAIRHSFFVENNLTMNIIPQSLQTELEWFNKSLEAQGCKGPTTRRKCNEAIHDALFWFGGMGGNDYIYALGSSVSSSTIQQLVLESVTAFLQALLKRGAEYIVVQGLPPTGCVCLSVLLYPEDKKDANGCVASLNEQSLHHNNLLQSKLRDLRAQFPHAVIVYADFWNSYETIMGNPGKYGFVEPFKACCGSGGGPYNFQFSGVCGTPLSSSCANPAQYINWDGVHLTEAMYKAVSESFLDGPFCRPPFEYLLSRKEQATRKY